MVQIWNVTKGSVESEALERSTCRNLGRTFCNVRYTCAGPSTAEGSRDILLFDILSSRSQGMGETCDIRMQMMRLVNTETSETDSPCEHAVASRVAGS